MTETLPPFDPHNPEYFETGLPFDEAESELLFERFEVVHRVPASR